MLTNSPFASTLGRWVRGSPEIELERIPPSATRDEVRAAVGRLLVEREHEVLVVDTFPRGLAGELAEHRPVASVARIFVHRDLTPQYASRPEVARAAAAYDAVLSPGERGPLADVVGAEETLPWLFLDADELRSRDDARAALGVRPRERCVLVLGSGDSAECRRRGELAARLAERLGERFAVRLVTLEPAGERAAVAMDGPILAWLPGADVVVGAGGYNTVHEARAVGVPLLGLAEPRLYDRQASRLTTTERVRDEEELVARLRALPPPAARPPPTYENGTHAAVRIVEERLDPACAEPGRR